MEFDRQNRGKTLKAVASKLKKTHLRALTWIKGVKLPQEGRGERSVPRRASISMQRPRHIPNGQTFDHQQARA